MASATGWKDAALFSGAASAMGGGPPPASGLFASSAPLTAPTTAPTTAPPPRQPSFLDDATQPESGVYSTLPDTPPLNQRKMQPSALATNPDTPAVQIEAVTRRMAELTRSVNKMLYKLESVEQSMNFIRQQNNDILAQALAQAQRYLMPANWNPCNIEFVDRRPPFGQPRPAFVPFMHGFSGTPSTHCPQVPQVPQAPQVPQVAHVAVEMPQHHPGATLFGGHVDPPKRAAQLTDLDKPMMREYGMPEDKDILMAYPVPIPNATNHVLFIMFDNLVHKYLDIPPERPRIGKELKLYCRVFEKMPPMFQAPVMPPIVDRLDQEGKKLYVSAEERLLLHRLARLMQAQSFWSRSYAEMEALVPQFGG